MFGTGLGGWLLGKLSCKSMCVMKHSVIIVSHNIDKEIYPLIIKVCICIILVMATGSSPVQYVYLD